MRNSYPVGFVVISATVALTGCTANAPIVVPAATPSPTAFLRQVDAGQAIGDAVGAPTGDLFYASVIATWSNLQEVASTACEQSIVGGDVPHAAFDKLVTAYNGAQHSIKVGGTSAPPGYPAAVPDFGASSWCDIATKLKEAKR